MMKDERRMMKDERRMMKDDDFKLLKGFALGWTNGQMNEQTFAIVELLLRLKMKNIHNFRSLRKTCLL